MAMAEVTKEKLESIVDLALDVLMSRDADAGWQNSSILGRVRDCGGVLPKGEVSTVTVWKKGWLLGDWKPKHRQALAVLEKIDEPYRQAVLINRAYLNRTTITEEPVTGKRTETYWSSERISRELGISKENFRARVHRGYKKLGKELEAAAGNIN
ncbi:hypothetical protein CLH62_14630 [Marinobacter guineae]|uniref:Uncharacterized protein n=1 Tax=Marinobacter guineae TaxID=432303 RepID=A0A2G1VBL6_9GAMM|nr:hypothetical protein [Marinobacter guineae]PHQ24167.1 hypothetical protein CLH62_14630 [Marinobacter guineae]